MRSIAFLSQKGGSGKTTLGIHIACAAQAAGERVLLIDTDSQGSASAWATVRKAEHPTVQKAMPGAHLKLDNAYSLVVIDTPPHAVPGVDIIAKMADFLVIPCRPSVLDLVAITSSVNVARASGTPAAFVLNACNPRTAEVEQSKKALLRHGYPVAPVEIGSRQAYSRALASGSAVTEFEAKGKAAEEIIELWKWLSTMLEGK
jgi:chromosome partitioning protein